MSRRLHNCSPALRACWHPVASVDGDFEDPTPVRLLGEHWVLARLDGELVALRDRCPHRGAPLSAGSVVGACLRCPYHGWTFGADGRCVDIPALGPAAAVPTRAATATASVATSGGLIWLALEEPITPLPQLPDPDAPGLVTDWRGGAAQMMDNFLDVGHFSFSHAQSFGVTDDADATELTVRREGWSVEIRHRHRARLVEDVGFEPGMSASYERSERFHYHAPFTLQLDLSYPELDDEVVLVFAVCPVDREHSRLFSFVHRNEAAAARVVDVTAALARGMQILDEDRSLLEQLPTNELDLDLRAELHTRADRNTVELRRVLADLVDAIDAIDGPVARAPSADSPDSTAKARTP